MNSTRQNIKFSSLLLLVISYTSIMAMENNPYEFDATKHCTGITTDHEDKLRAQHPLIKAIREKNFEQISNLLHSLDINGFDDVNRTPLHHAALIGNPQIIQLLLDHHAHVNATDQSGYTPLHLASSEGHLEAVRILLDNPGINLTIKNMHGETPLHYATLIGNPQIIQLLLDHHAHVNATDQSGYTPLHYAAGNGNSQIIQLLLAHGAYVNATDESGFTPLHIALLKGCLEAFHILLDDPDTDVTIKNKRGKTPLDMATFFKMDNIAQMIKEHIEKKKNQLNS